MIRSLGRTGESGVLKDAFGLGLLLLLITSVELLSFVAGA